jgi:phosphohistidine phosphatase
MELYVLRHAIAVQRGTEGYEQDSDRPLTSKGRQKMEQIASGMQALGLSFDLILSSPFLRARQTADVVADVFGAGKNVELSEHLAVGGDPESLVRELNSRFGSLKSVLIVGHEPYLSSLISVLLAGDPSLGLTMKKGGLCKLSVDSLSYGSCATLEWLLTPRQLRRVS